MDQGGPPSPMDTSMYQQGSNESDMSLDEQETEDEKMDTDDGDDVGESENECTAMEVVEEPSVLGNDFDGETLATARQEEEPDGRGWEEWNQRVMTMLLIELRAMRASLERKNMQ
ncbi:uncharacterized protein LOC144631470 isoform X2 [Oculina patagonica]